MSKFRTAILLLGSLIIAIVASLVTFLGLSSAGAIVTDPIQLVYTVEDNSKVYDGTPLSAKEYTLTEGELINGHKAYVSFTGAQVDVGTSKASVAVKILDEELFDVTDNYQIKVNEGNLEVTQKEISIELPDCEMVYNGEYLDIDRYAVTSGELVAGHSVRATTTKRIHEINEELTEDEIQPRVFDAVGNDVSANYKISFKHGVVKINPRPISVKPVDLTKVYDGQELTCDSYEIFAGSLVEGHTIQATYESSTGLEPKAKNAGVIRIQFKELKVLDAEGNDVSENYSISKETMGTLEITKRDLFVVAKSGTFEYDGQAHDLLSETTPEIVYGLVAGENLVVGYEGAVTKPGDVKENKISRWSITNGSVDNYNFDPKSSNYVQNGKLTITKKAIQVRLPQIEKTYDGVSIYDELVKAGATCDQLPKDHVISFSDKTKEYLKEQKKAGSFVYTVLPTEIIIKSKNVDVTDCFVISVNMGVYTINQAEINLIYNDKTNVLSKTYDGTALEFNANMVKENPDSTFKPHKDSGLTIKIDATAATAAFPKIYNLTDVRKYVSDIENAKEQGINITQYIKITDKDGKDISENFIIIPLYVIPEIKQQTSPINLSYSGKIVTESKEVVDIDTAKITINGLATGDKIKKEFISARYDFDTKKIKIYENVTILNEKDQDVTKLYKLAGEVNVIYVQDYIVSLNSIEKDYDGKSIFEKIDLIEDTKFTGYTAKFDEGVGEKDFSLFVNAGEGTYTVDSSKIKIEDGEHKNVTEQFNIIVIPNTYKINKLEANITYIDGSVSKEYDGQALTIDIAKLQTALPLGYTIDYSKVEENFPKDIITSADVSRHANEVDIAEYIKIKKGSEDVTINFDINAKLRVEIKQQTTGVEITYSGTLEVSSDIAIIDTTKLIVTLKQQDKIKEEILSLPVEVDGTTLKVNVAKNITILNDKGEDVTSLYKFKESKITATVNSSERVQVIIRAENVFSLTDSTFAKNLETVEKKAAYEAKLAYSIIGFEPMFAGDYIKYENIKLTIKGTTEAYYIEVSIDESGLIFDANGNDVTSKYYNVSLVNGAVIYLA